MNENYETFEQFWNDNYGKEYGNINKWRKIIEINC